MNDTPVQITFLSDDLLFLPTLVAAKSAIDHAPRNREVFIHIVLEHPTERQKHAIQALERPGIRTECRIPAPLQAQIGDLKNKTHLEFTTLAKMMLPEIFPELDRIIYLDCDVIVRDDISALFDIDLKGQPIGAVKDPGAGHMYPRKIHKDICMKASAGYFNSCVLLMDLKFLREWGSSKKMQTAMMFARQSRYLDQTAFNLEFSLRVHHMEPKWNLPISLLKKEIGKWTLPQFNEFFGTDYRSFQEITDAAAVWQYSEGLKPWESNAVFKYNDWLQTYRSVSGMYHDSTAVKFRKWKISASRRFNSLLIKARKRRLGIIRGFKNRLSNFIYSAIEEILEKRLTLERAKIRGPLALNKEKASCEIALSQQSGIAAPGEGNGIIVSITSYPGRVYDLQYTLHSLLTQTFRPERVILWLGSEKFPRGELDVPAPVLDLRKRGLEIRFTHDIGPFTKLIPALREFPNNPIVTADDDVYYQPDWLRGLVYAWKSCPSAIWAARVRTIQRDGHGLPSPFTGKANLTVRMDPSALLLPEGVAGVLYPPGSLDPQVFDDKKYLCITPKNDDLWFWAMAVLRGTKIGGAGNGPKRIMYVNPNREIGLNDDVTLWSQNGKGGWNDMQFAALLSEYPALIDVMEKAGL